jgi:hypothetical protein
MLRTIIAGLLIAVFAPSAIADTPYPGVWPKPSKDSSGGCMSLSGKYQYRGDVDRGDREGLPTIDRAAFNRMSIRGQPKAATFEHDIKSGVLTVQIEGDNIAPPERIKFTRELTCEGGWSVNLRQLGNCTHLDAAPFDCRQVRLLYTRAEDRSLIVHFTTLAVSKKTFAEPTKFAVDAWYRFELEAR